VALKVLPADFTNDAQRLARFQREAEILASLSHPNIGQIFGLETGVRVTDSDTGLAGSPITALVMELIEGRTLAERIEQGPIPPDEALNIALQLADALEAAHERQIVHRDLKPANIKLTPEGRVKVLDFGIAKAIEPMGHSGPQSPMLTTPAMTQSGMVLGTAAYMSPEQARGKAVDRRSDIWAFGCVLYEMLTGQPAFGAEDVPLTLARVLSQPLDLRRIAVNIPPALMQTLELCLEKDPKKRLADMSDVRLALKGRFDAAGSTSATPTKPGSRLRWLATTLALTALAVSATWLLKSAPAVDRSVNRFAYALPADQSLRVLNRNVLAVSPDGRRFAYNTNQGLFLRELGELEARLLPDTEQLLASPFFSPDGQSLAWFSSSGELKRLAVSGGAAAVIASGLVETPGDASWAADNTIYYSQSTGIWRVPATGGTPELVIAPESNESYSNPELLPDGDTLLFVVFRSGNLNDLTNAEIAVQSLTSGQRSMLLQGNDPQYLPSGHLVYGLDGGLFAIAFDPGTFTVSGGSVPLVQELSGATATWNYRVADNGTLMYLSGLFASNLTILVWVDRDGTETALAIEPGNFTYPRISPTGDRVVLGNSGSANGLWVWDFAAETRTQLTIGEAEGSYGAWTTDGARIAYSSGNSIDWKAANNTGQATRMTEFTSGGLQSPSAYFFSPSGEELVYRHQQDPVTNDDIAMIKVGGTAEPQWLLHETYIERNAELSPNGRWMAYQSDESGRFEIYVRPFPNVDDDRVLVSNASGEKPLWSRDGKELFYLQRADNGQLQLLSVAVDTEATRFSFSTRTPLMDWAYLSDTEGRPYEVSLDGQRFLAIKLYVDPEAGASAAPEVIIVQNWTEELQRLVPVAR
jgi:eukaryotic-like serine/threonine-protein kinase